MRRRLYGATIVNDVGDKKVSGTFSQPHAPFSAFLGRPMGRRVLVKPGRAAVRLTRFSPSKGWPRSTQPRMASTSPSIGLRQWHELTTAHTRF